MKTWIEYIGLSLFLVVVPLLWSPSPVAAADMEFRPYLSISEEFNDNIFEVPTNKRHELITRVQPGATFRYQTPLWTWNTVYNFDYRNYARNSRGDEFNHTAALTGNIALLDNFLFLDVSDTYQRVTLDVTRNATTQSSLFLNQTDQNTAIISPYLLWRFGEKGTLKTGYRYSDIRYWGEGIERREQGAFAELNRQVSSKFSLSAGYAFTRLESQPIRYNKHDLSGGFRFEYADKSFIFGQIGNSWQQFDRGADASFLFWNAGVTHDFRFAVVTVESRVQTAVDPLAVSTKETSYTGRLEKTLQRGMVGASAAYSEFVDTQTDSENRRSLTFSASGRYEILQSLTASLVATAERFSRNTGSGLPYHLNATGGLSYAFNRDLTLSLNYTYDTQRNELDNAAGAIVTNRVVVEVRKMF